MAVLDERGRNEQAMVGRLLDEGHDGRQTGRCGGEGGQPRGGEPHRDLRGEVLEEVARQPQLGEDDQADATLPGVRDERVMALQVRLEVTEAGCDLSEA